MAIKYLEQQPGYKDFGNQKEKKLNESNPFPDQNSSSVISKTGEREGSVIGLLKKTSTQLEAEEKIPGSEIKLSNPLAEAQDDNGEYFEQQTDPTLSNNALNQTPVIQSSEIEDNEAIRMEQEEIAQAIELSNQEQN